MPHPACAGLSPGPVQFTSYVSFKYLSVLLSIHADGNLNQAFFILYLVSEGTSLPAWSPFFHSSLVSIFHVHTALLWDKADHVMPFLKNLLWEDEYVCKCMWIVLTWFCFLCRPHVLLLRWIVHLFEKYLLGTCCVPSTLWDKASNRADVAPALSPQGKVASVSVREALPEGAGNSDFVVCVCGGRHKKPPQRGDS